MPRRFGHNCFYMRKGFAPFKNLSISTRSRPGMTLIELMIVLLVSIIVLGAAFSLYQVNARYYVAQDALLEQQQNLRAALYSISRDVRMAGNGLGLMGVERLNFYDVRNDDWFIHQDSDGDDLQKPGVRAIWGQDNVAANGETDTLTVFHADVENAQPLGTLNAAYDMGDSLSLSEALASDMLYGGDIIAVANDNGDALLLEVERSGSATDKPASVTGSTVNIGERFKPGKPLANTFPSGSNVYRLRDATIVTYSLDAANHRLMAAYYGLGDSGSDELYDTSSDNSGRVVLANDIEDFQLCYILNKQDSLEGTNINLLEDVNCIYGGVRENDDLNGDGDKLDEGELDNGGAHISAVRLALVSRSPIANESTGFGRPRSVFNHTVEEQTIDGHQRRVLTDTIYLRNY